jgi:hypothetical protein
MSHEMEGVSIIFRKLLKNDLVEEPVNQEHLKVCNFMDMVNSRLGADLGLMVDASVDHVGAALQQWTEPAAEWQPLGFFSKKLDQTQQRHSAYDRELLACVLGIRHFQFMLEGRQFTLYTDHKLLTHALAKAVEPWTARQSRHLSCLAELTSDIRHISGMDNVVADTLSRPLMGEINALAATPVQVDYDAIAEAQHACTETMVASELHPPAGPIWRDPAPLRHQRTSTQATDSVGLPLKALHRLPQPLTPRLQGPGLANYNRRPASMGTATTSKIRPLSDNTKV